jgi:hypothetical protein
VSTGTLLFSGTDLATVCIVEDLSDFWSTSDLRGDLPTSAGVPGAAPLRRPVASKVRSGTVTTPETTTLADTEDAVATIKALLRINRAQVATRRKITGSGNLDTTQTVIVRGAEERWTGNVSCTLILSVETCDGPWYGASQSIAAVGPVTIKGDSPTRKITATLSAGAVDPVVSNTNGYSFRFVGTVPAGGVLVDVLARTATGITGSVPLSSALKWSKDDPFQLDPGAQTLAVSAGTASFTYYPAYV